MSEPSPASTKADLATSTALTNVGALLNRARQLHSMFPAYFQDAGKHDHFRDFGFPEVLTPALLERLYRRNGLAAAGVRKTVTKTWAKPPVVMDSPAEGGESVSEKEVASAFKRLRLFPQCKEADRRALVNGYSGLILRIKDSQPFSAPVEIKSGGLDALAEVIPAWRTQLQVAEWDTTETSETYGQPLMYQFQELAVEGSTRPGRNVTVHPDRVILWSEDGTTDANSALEAGYNDALTAAKIVGAGGEGFWKNAKNSPILSVDKEVDAAKMASTMGVKPEELADAIGKQVDSFNKGFDSTMVFQGTTADTLNVSMPVPEHFFAIAVQCFAASLEMPVKILIGMQTGERASQEDQREWATTCQTRRTDYVEPLLDALVERLKRFGILSSADWFIHWPDIMEDSPGERLERAERMAKINTQMRPTNELVFTHDEIREETGRMESLTPDEAMFRSDDMVDDFDRDSGDLTDPDDTPEEDA